MVVPSGVHYGSWSGPMFLRGFWAGRHHSARGLVRGHPVLSDPGNALREGLKISWAKHGKTVGILPPCSSQQFPIKCISINWQDILLTASPQLESNVFIATWQKIPQKSWHENMQPLSRRLFEAEGTQMASTW